MFKNAIVIKPGKSIINGLTTANLGIPDYEKALVQHHLYCKALEKCGLDVLALESEEGYPDSTFVEDVALLTPHCAIIMNPGAPSRKGEIEKIKPVVSRFYSSIEEIKEPGTVEAGDIMMAGDHYFVGLSARTNRNGANQVIKILNKYGMSGTKIKLENVLHLKTGLAYIENNNLMICGEFLANPEFDIFNKIEVPENESYAANCIWVNGTVIIPSGFPVTKKRISDLGYSVIDLDMTEFQKSDGGLSCLSLRF